MSCVKWGLGGLLVGGGLFLLMANLWVLSYGQQATAALEQLPQVQACLVLGTNKWVSDGRPNLFYNHRINAAAQVYQAGKCGKIVVSGANPTHQYNEPEEMRRSLVALGIPEAAIVCDYAGSRTLDSVLRFKHIFGQSSGIVVSQAFHNARAIYIGHHHQMSLAGFNAQEVDAYGSLKTKLREIFSKGRAVLDVMVFHSKARHYGEPIAL